MTVLLVATTRFEVDQKRKRVSCYLFLGDTEWRSKLIAAVTDCSFNTESAHVLTEQFEDTRCLLSPGKFDFGILRNIVK